MGTATELQSSIEKLQREAHGAKFVSIGAQIAAAGGKVGKVTRNRTLQLACVAGAESGAFCCEVLECNASLIWISSEDNGSQQLNLAVWLGDCTNVDDVQAILLHRAQCDRAARYGKYSDAIESPNKEALLNSDSDEKQKS